MKNVSFKYAVSILYVKANDRIVLVPSMVLTTVLMCVLIEILPQLIPLWIDYTNKSTEV